MQTKRVEKRINEIKLGALINQLRINKLTVDQTKRGTESQKQLTNDQ